MNNKKIMGGDAYVRWKIFWTVIIMLFVIGLGLLIIYSEYLRGISEKSCQIKCDRLGALFYKITPNNEMNVHDYCTCYGDDWIKSFRV